MTLRWMAGCSRRTPGARLRSAVLSVAVIGLIGAAGCPAKKGSKSDPGKAGASDEGALAKYADAVAAQWKAQGGKFFKTGYLVFCRGDSVWEGGPLDTLGWTPPMGAKSRSYCYNVSDDLKKVALSVGDGSGENQLCQVLDGSSGKVARSASKRTSKCLP